MRVRQVFTLLLLLTMLLGLGFFILGGIRTFLGEISRASSAAFPHTSLAAFFVKGASNRKPVPCKGFKLWV